MVESINNPDILISNYKRQIKLDEITLKKKLFDRAPIDEIQELQRRMQICRDTIDLIEQNKYQQTLTDLHSWLDVT